MSHSRGGKNRRQVPTERAILFFSRGAGWGGKGKSCRGIEKKKKGEKEKRGEGSLGGTRVRRDSGSYGRSDMNGDRLETLFSKGGSTVRVMNEWMNG